MELSTEAENGMCVCVGGCTTLIISSFLYKAETAECSCLKIVAVFLCTIWQKCCIVIK